MIPDSIDPVVGWRAWGLVPSAPRARVGPHTSWFLTSVFAKHTWPPRRRMSAHCPSCSRPPAVLCSCGLYAFHSIEDLPLCPYQACVLGSVSGWGRVVEHRRGWRSTYAYPVSLFLFCARCLRDSWRLKAAERVLVLDGRESSATALCLEHAVHDRLGLLSQRVRVDEIESELLALYGVGRSDFV